jgi:hypothetical protein
MALINHIQVVLFYNMHTNVIDLLAITHLNSNIEPTNVNNLDNTRYQPLSSATHPLQCFRCHFLLQTQQDTELLNRSCPITSAFLSSLRLFLRQISPSECTPLAFGLTP